METSNSMAGGEPITLGLYTTWDNGNKQFHGRRWTYYTRTVHNMGQWKQRFKHKNEVCFCCLVYYHSPCTERVGFFLTVKGNISAIQSFKPKPHSVGWMWENLFQLYCVRSGMTHVNSHQTKFLAWELLRITKKEKKRKEKICAQSTTFAFLLFAWSSKSVSAIAVTSSTK